MTKKSVSTINVEDEMMTMSDLYDKIKMFPVEENDENSRSADNSQKYIKMVLP